MLEYFWPSFPQKWRGVCTLMACFLMNLSAAIFQLWACINIYAMSYFKLKGDPGLKNSSGVVFLPLYMISISCSGLLSMKITSKLGLNLTVAVVGVCLATCSVLSSFMTNIHSFMAIFSVLEGIQVGILAMIPVQTAYLFYPKNRGCVAGILQMAFGLGGSIFNFIAFQVVNPDNVMPLIAHGDQEERYFGPEISERFPLFLRYIAVYQFGLNMIACVLMFRPPVKTDQSPQPTEIEITQNLIEPDSQKEDKPNSDALLEHTEYPYEKTVSKALLSPAFLQSFAMAFLSSGASYLITINMKNYGITIIPDDQVITIIASASSFANGSTRILWGVLFDKLGFKRFYAFLLIALTIAIILYCPTAGNSFLFGMNNVIIMTVLGAHFCVFSPMWSHIFHPSISTTVVAYGFFAFSSAGIYQFLLVNYFDFLFSYEQIVYLQILLCVISFVILMFYKKPPDYPHK